jgi:hypothetical protein
VLQTYKETYLEIKELVFGEHSIDIENYAQELAGRSKLSFDDIKNVYNRYSLLKIALKNPTYISGNKRIWETCEDEILLTYMDLALTEYNEKGKKKPRKTVIVELEELFVERTAQSISFRYYDLNKPKKDDEKPKTKLKSKHKPKSNTPLQAELEIEVTETLSKPEVAVTELKPAESKDNDDLLDIVVNLVNNLDKAEVGVNTLFKGLLTLSEKAMDNNNSGEKIKRLEGQVSSLEDELNKEKDKNKQLQIEISMLVSKFEKLSREIEYFNGLDGKQKLQQLNQFNDNLKYIVDKFGVVILNENELNKAI